MGVGITLNTILAILTTTGRVCLLLPVAECISQQKWAWFSSSPKPLTDLETFDRGSRGAYGSLVLLWRINLRQFVSLGALLLLLGLAVDPLSQQLLHYEHQPQADLSSPAYVSTSLTWSTTSQADGLFNWKQSDKDVLTGIQDPPLFMKSAVQNGLLTLGSRLNDTQPFCGTGNCTWPPYRSLAVCMRWQDITTHLGYSQYNDTKNITIRRWSLNNRSYIETGEYSTSVLNLSSVAKPKPIRDTPSPVNGLDFTDTIAFPDNPYPLADVFMIYRNWSEKSSESKSPYSAMEFVLEWCVQEFSTLIMNGAVITARHESTNNFTGGGGYLTGPLFNSTSKFGFASGRPNYDVSNDTHFIISNYLRKTLDGSIHLQGADLYKTSDAAEAFYQRINIDSGNGNVLNTTTDQAGLAEVVQNIATSMTNMVRQTDHTYSSMDRKLINKFTVANGTAWRDQTFVRVQWAWITAPMTLVLLSVIFVTITIVQSSMQTNKNGFQIWKSSSLSTLIALSDKLHKDVGGLHSLSETERSLNGKKASLARGSDGKWRL
ncbi:hypothetical protein EYC84_008433 [Monilinia fructicola]|uniref:Uncharacterized protein n=1 Tax=Monilinia fructicola TaxID=38448 RepID=A0A5M9JEK6_MONFR|nr:hypothetical protein EYC84_008433 [Monilinia fructicola]